MRKIYDEEIIFLRHLGFNLRDIARMKSMSYNQLWYRHRKLVFLGYLEATRAGGNPAFAAHARKLAKDRFKKLMEEFENHGGVIEIRQSQVLNRLVKQRKVFKIPISLRYGSGGYKRGTNERLFKKKYLGKTYLCQSRTALVRFLQKVCKRPRTKALQHQLSCYLRKHLSEAEKIAVLFSLGACPDASTWKSTISVDGIPSRIERVATRRQRQSATMKLRKKNGKNKYLHTQRPK